jgi:hypothetical protein
LNDFGQVAFVADGKHGRAFGVYIATPVGPQIESVKLKQKQGSLELRVNGTGFITKDTVIEINGETLVSMSYPADFQEDGGTTRRVVSRDRRLEDLLPAGQTVEVTVYNSLTNLRSAVVTLSR